MSIDHRPGYRRVRVTRKQTLAEKIKFFLAMPHLKRRDRNQRVAIVGVVVLLLVYLFMLRPLFEILYPDAITKPQQAAPAGKGGLRQKK